MVARVIVDISNSEVDRIFDYQIPVHFIVECGDRVLVPFGNRTIEGYCISISDNSDCGIELKCILRKLDESPLILPEMIKLMEFMKEKYFIRFVDSLRLFIPSKLRGNKVKARMKEYCSLVDTMSYEEVLALIPKRAKAQLAVAERLRDSGEFLTVLATEFSNSAINALVKLGVVSRYGMEVKRTPFKGISSVDSDFKLTDMQNNSVDKIFNSEKDVILLHGVTGSGKTEVYLACIEKVLAEGKTAIMLVPEISLTPQILRIFRGRFGDMVAMLHSGLSDGERYDEWRRIYDGDARIVVGARSAIFAPMRDVGIIIIDEEHDSSYISESNPRYSTIDIARFRAEYNDCHVVAGSATPSVDSYQKAKHKEYEIAVMNKRISANGMPEVAIVDMALELRRGNFGLFSTDLREAIIDTVEAGNQAMIFLNRRGYASYMQCKSCGYIAKCTDCDVSLTYHHQDGLLKCHYCGKRFKPLTQCPDCSSESIKQGKIGTERVVRELTDLLGNDVGILRMDNDTTTTKTAYLDILGAFKAGEAKVLVGTQMIAKGHDFPDVTLVGVLDADMSLYFSDYRSSERTFQLITQVAGRCGRSVKKGRVLVQTYSPKHYLFNFIKSYDYEGFFDKEVNNRKVTSFPPFATIIRVLISSESEDKCVETAKHIYTELKLIKAKTPDKFIYMQAMKSPVTRIQSKFRYQIVMRVNRQHEQDLIGEIHGILDSKKVRGVSVFVEINPQSMS